MNKKRLTDAVAEAKAETKNALQIFYNALNQGQKKQIVKKKDVKEVLDRFGVEYEE